jgi:flagellar motor switch protein FliN/FliY
MPEQQAVSDVEFGKISPGNEVQSSPEDQQKNLEMLFDVPVSVTAELGRTVVKVRDLLNFTPGSVIELERLAGESIDLMVNGVLIGKGDVVVVNENFGLRITEIVCTEERIKKLSD